MANKFYEPGARRAEKVQDLFAAIAPRYDLINDLQSLGWHRYWKRRLVALAEPLAGERALDVCCGTGDITFALAAHGTITTGLDFSHGMLEVARRRLDRTADSASGRVEFLQGNALALPFADGAFDLVTISYGLRNLADFQAGLRELTRVLAPGGRLVVLDFGKPENTLWRWLYFQHLRWVCPIFGRLFCGDAATHAYILDSLRAYPAQKGVDAGLRELGITDTRLINLLGGMMSLNYGRRASKLT